MRRGLLYYANMCKCHGGLKGHPKLIGELEALLGRVDHFCVQTSIIKPIALSFPNARL